MQRNVPNIRKAFREIGHVAFVLRMSPVTKIPADEFMAKNAVIRFIRAVG